MARPKGVKDSKPRKKKKSIKKKKVQQVQKKQPPEITPYPQAGENPEFEGLLDRMDLDETKKPQQPPNVTLSTGEQVLSARDVSEWVSWPFASWSIYNKMPQLKISDAEALSIAEPLTNILNRHGAGELIPPDLLDGLKIAGRLTPIMNERFKAIKQERLRRRTAQDAQVNNQAGGNQEARTPATNETQGAPFRKPERVRH